MRRVFGVPPSDIERAVREEAKRRKGLIENLLAEHHVQSYQLHSLKAEATEAIPKMTAKLGIDLLVIGTVALTKAASKA